MSSAEAIGSFGVLAQVSKALLHGRILIAVGDVGRAAAMRTILAQAGAEVRLAQTGRAALNALTPEAPDLLLLDIGLPDIRSAEMIRQIKMTDETRYLPVVVLIEEADDPEHCLKDGADDFLKQPIAPAELILRVKLLLRLSRLHQDLADNNRELQAAYETARESEAKYRALIQDAQDALVLINPLTSTILEANQCARDLSGYLDDDLVGQPVTMLCADSTQTSWDKILQEVTSVGHVSIADGILRCKNGELFPIEIQASLANHHLGEPLIQVLVRDIRPRQQLDAERTKSERLAAVVETAVTVNHEINNPLLVITSSVESLQRALFESDSSVREKLERISEACRRIQRFTQQLTSVIAPVSKEYLPGMRMLDMEQSLAADEPPSQS